MYLYVQNKLTRYLTPLRSKYSPQHPILKYLQPTFLPQCERPSFTQVQNNRQNYGYVYPLSLTMSNKTKCVTVTLYKMNILFLFWYEKECRTVNNTMCNCTTVWHECR